MQKCFADGDDIAMLSDILIIKRCFIIRLIHSPNKTDNLKNFFYSLLVKAKQIKSPTSFTVNFYQCIFCMQKDLKKPIIVNVCIIHVLVAVLDPYSVICFVFPRDI